jgi:hypothetical protein
MGLSLDPINQVYGISSPEGGPFRRCAGPTSTTSSWDTILMMEGRRSLTSEQWRITLIYWIGFTVAFLVITIPTHTFSSAIADVAFAVVAGSLIGFISYRIQLRGQSRK